MECGSINLPGLVLTDEKKSMLSMGATIADPNPCKKKKKKVF